MASVCWGRHGLHPEPHVAVVKVLLVLVNHASGLRNNRALQWLERDWAEAGVLSEAPLLSIDTICARWCAHHMHWLTHGSGPSWYWTEFVVRILLLLLLLLLVSHLVHRAREQRHATLHRLAHGSHPRRFFTQLTVVERILLLLLLVLHLAHSAREQRHATLHRLTHGSHPGRYFTQLTVVERILSHHVRWAHRAQLRLLRWHALCHRLAHGSRPRGYFAKIVLLLLRQRSMHRHSGDAGHALVHAGSARPSQLRVAELLDVVCVAAVLSKAALATQIEAAHRGLVEIAGGPQVFGAVREAAVAVVALPVGKHLVAQRGLCQVGHLVQLVIAVRVLARCSPHAKALLPETANLGFEELLREASSPRRGCCTVRAGGRPTGTPGSHDSLLAAPVGVARLPGLAASVRTAHR
mmetsp:Transcript_116944/g.364073  ORF Transcript_116944/g.364073 Transcript_116944/m.364073 type:complete len:410 (-) Transcript_116944:154-1383(-)